MNWLGLSDTLWALIVSTHLPCPVLYLAPHGYFRTVPKEIEECALVDGAAGCRALLILLPSALPGMICAALFGFTLSWNEFLYSLVFVSPADKTMTVGVSADLFRGDIYYWGSLMAGACMARCRS